MILLFAKDITAQLVICCNHKTACFDLSVITSAAMHYYTCITVKNGLDLGNFAWAS